MARIVSQFSTSLDGFIAGPDDQVGPLFDWYDNGEVEVTPPSDGYPITFHMSEASARYWRQVDREGAFVTGRRLFDFTKGWGGRPPGGSPTFVVSHRPPPGDWPPVPDAPFTFVDNLDDALDQARAVAGDGDVGVAGADLVQQCLQAGHLDEVRIDLVPVLLGSGIRYFDNLAGGPIAFEDPEIFQGTRVTHLIYRAKRS